MLSSYNFTDESENHLVVSDSLQPHRLYSPCNSPSQNIGVDSPSLLQGIFPTQGSNSGLTHCGWILLPAKPQGKPKNTGVGSLFLLQRIFPTQESKLGLLHCRWILYQLSYQGSQFYWWWHIIKTYIHDSRHFGTSLKLKYCWTS